MVAFNVIDCMGKERRFNGLKHAWGFDKFIPLRAFNDASNGYLVEDTCVFDAEVLVKERNKFKGECLSIKEIASSCKYVWKIENFSKLDAGYEESQVSMLEITNGVEDFNLFFNLYRYNK